MTSKRPKFGKRILLLDCDGVLTPKKTYYSSEGKLFKIFDSDDSYALKYFKKLSYDIIIVTADSYGFPITKSRAKDWGVEAILSKNKGETIRRILKKSYDLSVYVGNGPEDADIIKIVDKFFGPSDSRPEILKLIDDPKFQILDSVGGGGVVWEVFKLLHSDKGKYE